MTWRPATRRLAAALVAVGLLLVGQALYVVGDGTWVQARARRQLARAARDAEMQARRDAAAFAAAPATVPPPTPRHYREGDPIGEIGIARLNLAVVIGEGQSTATLRRGAGHLPGTALPGASGNVVIAAHRDTFFRPLKDVARGDVIVVTTPAGRFEYQVEKTEIVAPNAVRVLQPRGSQTLTLITCFPFYFVGAAPKRFIVMARASETQKH